MKKILIFYLCIVSSAALFAEQTFVIDDLGYKVLNSEDFTYDFPIVEVCKCYIYSGAARHVSIPDSVEWNDTVYTVIGIGNHAFGRARIKSISFPKHLEYVEDFAFTESSIESVSIPSTLSVFGISVFYNCTELRKVVWASNLETIPANTFDGCISLEMVKIPEGVKTIDSSFSGCIKLAHIELPESLETLIGSFYGCSGLYELPKIPKTVKNIGSNLFCMCNGLQVVDEWEYYGTDITANMFLECRNLRSITIPASVTHIREGAFQECSGLRTVKLMGDVVKIDKLVFTGSWKLNNPPSFIEDFYCYGSVVPEVDPSAFSWNLGGTPTPTSEQYEWELFGIKMFFYDPFIYNEWDEEINADREYVLSQWNRINTATLHVPRALLNQYRNTFPWYKFGKIVAIEDEETSITPIADTQNTNIHTIYNLSGSPLHGLQKGINIVGGKKVLVR